MVASSKVVELCQQLFSWGVGEISLGDTIGAATPQSVVNLIEALKCKVDLAKLALQRMLPITMVPLTTHRVSGCLLSPDLTVTPLILNCSFT